MPTKSKNQKIKKSKLTIERKSCWSVWGDETKKQAFDFSEGYKQFLDNSKTERETVREGIRLAKENGFIDWEDFKKTAGNLTSKELAGKKIYFINREKSLFLTILGKKDLSHGINMLIAHVDSPRLDLKVNPLYEDEELAYFKTHYYGGIKKYQWPTIPLAMHGVIINSSGEKINICIGEKDDDPIFMITDLLPHLGKEQMKKTLDIAIEGEELNILLGSIPVKDSKIKEKVKYAILKYLNKEYGLIEEDFLSAEIQMVPAQKAKDLGFDRSLIAGYGHDDRSNAYSALRAILDVKNCEKTLMTVFIDKEEIGSDGSSSMKSLFLENIIEKLITITNSKCSVIDLFSQSKVLSVDGTVGYDPDYKQVCDSRNTARINHGVVIEKYTGHGGKFCASEASAEFTREVRNIFNNNNKIVWQTGGMGKVDQGGGGTIASYLANRNVDVIDCGVPMFNVHAPMEIIGKGDLYSAYLAYGAFLREA
ncbi:MAG: aminopeptidase [bacterium]